MNNLLKLIIILICSSVLCVYNNSNNGVGVNASTLPSQSPIIPYINNDNNNNINCKYSIITVIVDGSKPSPKNYTCGGEDMTFNNIHDALTYYDTVKTIQDPDSQIWIYQQFNIKLADGKHNIYDCIYSFSYNLTISPLIDGSTNVNISNGINGFFAIMPFDVSSDKNYASSLSITGVNFIALPSMSRSFIDIIAELSTVYVTIDRCTLGETFSKLNQIFSINGKENEGTIVPPSPVFVTISNCIISGISFNQLKGYIVIELHNAQLKIVNTDFISISGSYNIIDSYNSILVIDNCSFNNTTLSSSLLYLYNTTFEIHNSNFINNQNNATLGVVMFLENNSNGIITSSNFTDNYQILGNSTKPQASGPLFINDGSVLSVSTSYFSSKHLPYTEAGQIVTSNSQSNVSFDHCIFIANDQYAYACLNGNLTFTNCNVKPLFFCFSCNHGSINNVEYCKHDSSSNSMFKSSSLSFIYFVLFMILILNIL